MAWIELAEVDVLSRLTDAEVAACKNAAVRAGQPDAISKNISMCIQEWRGAIRRHHKLADGQKIPSELEIHVLADIRYRLFTRLPGMNTFLDELRVAEWREANTVKRNLKGYVFEDAIDAEADAGGVPAPDVGEERSEFSQENLDGV